VIFKTWFYKHNIISQSKIYIVDKTDNVDQEVQNTSSQENLSFTQKQVQRILKMINEIILLTF